MAEGIGDNRSDVIRKAIERFADIERRAEIGQAIADSYRRLPQSDDDDS